MSKVAPVAAYDSRGAVANSFLEQAEVCREQAREAARLKRFGAALGLFATAATLCRHVKSIETDARACSQIDDRLRQIDLEAATYSELARATQKLARHA